jgi:hypothetical protein
MKILRNERGLSRLQAIRFGIQSRARRHGLIVALFQSIGIFIQDFCRTLLFWTLRLSLVYPVIALTRVAKFVTRPFKRSKINQKKTDTA